VGVPVTGRRLALAESPREQGLQVQAIARVGLAFTSEAALLLTLGPCQHWIRLDADTLRDMLAPLRVTSIRVDPRPVAELRPLRRQPAASPLSRPSWLRASSEGAIGQRPVVALGVRADLGLDFLLQVDAGHLRQAEQVDRHVGEFLPDIDAALAPGIEGLGHLALQQAELQRHVGRVESLGELVVPGEQLS
jgi:hypothetical protein